MSDELDIKKLKFTSTVFPTEEDIKLWESLTPLQQHERVVYELDEARKSGIVDPEPFQARVDRVKKQRETGGS